MWANPQETVDLVTFTEEINGKLQFLCIESYFLQFQVLSGIQVYIKFERGCQKPWMTINLYKINLSRQQSFCLPSKQDQRK